MSNSIDDKELHNDILEETITPSDLSDLGVLVKIYIFYYELLKATISVYCASPRGLLT